MSGHWTCYDAAASSHDNLAVPSIFEPPARDLVALLDVRGAGAILDIGAGTGVASRIAAAATPGALIVALDPAEAMLRVASHHGLRTVRATVPGLPFPRASFDRVMASFVLSHMGECEAGLHDMVRVLRGTGRIGVTAWGPLENEYRQRWQVLAEEAVGQEPLARAVNEALPGEDRFAEPAALESVLRAAGVRAVELHYRKYEVRTTIADFLAIRQDSIYGRFVRKSLDEREWGEFKSRLDSDFRKRYTDPVVYERDVHIAVGQASACGGL